MEPIQSESFLRAKKRVNNLKHFYKHLRLYIIINILLLFFKIRALEFFSEKGIGDEGFLNWFEWNIIGTPILWGIGLGLHAAYVFVLKSKTLREMTPKFYGEWEDRQLKKYIEEEHANARRFE